MTDTTTNLGLIKPQVGGDDGTWGGSLNGNMDLIDAFAGKTPVLLTSGAVISSAPITLALPSAYTLFRLELGNLNTASVAIFAQFSIDGATYLGTGYDFVRSDLSAKASGTQTYAAATGGAGAAIILSDMIKNQANDTDTGGLFTIEVNNKLAGTNARITAKALGTYVNNDGGGYRTVSTTGGALIGQSAVAQKVKIGSVSAGDYSGGVRGAYALYGVAGLG